MNAKERFYSGLAKETIGKITSNTDNWTSFLRTMSRNYEFTYPEQVMIYAQRPNATFCKPYEDWNAENYRRYVKRGSTGIALFVMNRDIIDDDRRLNAERMEAAFYSGRQATPEPVQPAATESSADDKELLLKLLQNPEMAALLKSLAKTL